MKGAFPKVVFSMAFHQKYLNPKSYILIHTRMQTYQHKWGDHDLALQKMETSGMTIYFEGASKAKFQRTTF